MLLITIVPFLLLQSEFKVGAFTSIIALFAALVSYAFRKVKLANQLRLGYAGGVGRLFSNIILAVFWTTPALVIQGLLNKVLAVFNDPIFKSVHINNAEYILGPDVNKEALELNLVDNTMALIGNTIAMITFLAILSLGVSNQIAALRYLLVAYGVWKIANYIWNLSMRRRFAHLEQAA